MVAPKKNMGVKVILPVHLELVTSSEIADKHSKQIESSLFLLGNLNLYILGGKSKKWATWHICSAAWWSDITMSLKYSCTLIKSDQISHYITFSNKDNYSY